MGILWPCTLQIFFVGMGSEAGYKASVRALITREYAEPLASMLASRQVASIHVPCIQLIPTGTPRPTEPCDGAVLITSAAVARFVPNLAAALGDAKVFAVGPRTAASLAAVAVDVAYTGSMGGVEALRQMVQTESSDYWYIGARDPSSGLKIALRAHGVKTWGVYENTVPAGLETALTRASYDIALFSSGSAVRAYVAAVGIPTVPTVMIGSATCAVATSLGVEATTVAAEPTMEAMAHSAARFR